MMRWFLFVVLLIIPSAAFAQDSNYAWCGYVLIENLVIEEAQLEKISTFFPNPEDVPPNETMGVLQSDDGYTTIIDGCWLFPPERQVMVSLIEQADGLSYEDADLNLVYYQFTGETQGESATAARQYIIENIHRFNGDPMDDYET